MARRANSPRKAAAKSTKTRRRAPIQSAETAKSTRGASTKPRAKRAKSATLGTKVDRCVATLDGLRKECAAKLRELMQERRAHASATHKMRRARKQLGRSAWIKSSARQVGLGLRHGAELADPRKLFTESSKKTRRKQFDRVAKFCKKEWKELAALVGRLDSLANNPNPPAPAKSRRK